LVSEKSKIGACAAGPKVRAIVAAGTDARRQLGRSAMAEEPAPEPAPADAEGLFAKADALTEAEDPSGALAVLLDGETE
jgi:hypothetical protein